MTAVLGYNWGMVNLKKFTSINTDEICERMGKGTVLDTFSILLNGNIAMVFKTPLEKGENTRINIKIHNRLGVQRQCSFTAIDSKVVSVLFDRNILYVFMLDGNNRLTFDRLDPDTKEDLFPLVQGVPEQIIYQNKDDFIISYSDELIHYQEKKQEHLDKAIVSLDRNRRYIFCEEDGKGFLELLNKNRLIYKADNVYENDRPLFDEPLDDCFMIKDTIAVRTKGTITVYKVQ